jgi:four helix bundle protein
MFGLTSQLRRAGASVAANLAEGSGRTQIEFGRFVQIALGSACEVEYHLLLAHDLSYLPTGRFDYLIEEIRTVKRMLAALLKTVRARQVK